MGGECRRERTSDTWRWQERRSTPPQFWHELIDRKKREEKREENYKGKRRNRRPIISPPEKEQKADHKSRGLSPTKNN